MIAALFAGETVTHRGRIVVVEAKLYSRPDQPVPLLGAAVSEESTRQVAKWANGLLTTASGPESLRRVVEAYRAAGGRGPIIGQAAVSWAPSEDEAMRQAMDQWAACSIGGEVNWDLRRPADFDLASAAVGQEQVRKSVFVSPDLGRHAEHLYQLAEAGLTELHVHPVGRNQCEVIEAFGRSVLPKLS